MRWLTAFAIDISIVHVKGGTLLGSRYGLYGIFRFKHLSSLWGQLTGLLPRKLNPHQPAILQSFSKTDSNLLSNAALQIGDA